MASPTEIANGFASRLRAEGVRSSFTRTLEFLRAMECVGVDVPTSVYWAGRATLLSRPEDVTIYDRCFEEYFLGRGKIDVSVAPQEHTTVVLLDDEEDESPGGEEMQEIEADSVISLRFSQVETLRHKDFGTLSDAERAQCARVMAAFRFSPPRRPSKRYQKAHRGPRLDLRRTVRAAIAREGEPIEQFMVDQSQRVRRVVFICDISGSMESYSKELIRFVHAAMMGTRRVEVFTLGTRLTRITRELSTLDVERALSQSSSKVQDWSGGTRLGDGIKAFNDRYGVRGLARGSTVVILSDGWDRGDVSVLDTEMARLARVSHRVVWVNPLKASPGYAPLARGMAAAMPHIDEFVEGHSLSSLEYLAEVIAK